MVTPSVPVRPNRRHGDTNRNQTSMATLDDGRNKQKMGHACDWLSGTWDHDRKRRPRPDSFLSSRPGAPLVITHKRLPIGTDA